MGLLPWPAVIVEVGACRKEGARHVVRWTEDHAGTTKRRSFGRKARAAVEARRRELLELQLAQQPERPAGGPLDELAELGELGSTADWDRAVQNAARAAHRAAVQGDGQTLSLIKKYTSVLVALSGEGMAWRCVAELERTVESQNEYLDEVRRRISTENSAGAVRGPGLGRADGPEDQVCRPGDKPS
jgi:hypothetical protein